MGSGNTKRYWKFICTKDTEAECFQRSLFGDTKKWLETVEKVKKGDTLFLYNVETDVLFGPFKAESDGGTEIVSEAWGGRFLAQVKVSWDTIAVLVNASKEFAFLRKKKLELSEVEGRKILGKIKAIKFELPPNLEREVQELQKLDEEIHSLAHRIEEVKTSTKWHPADREVELDRLKGEFYLKMKEFVWAVRRLDKHAKILNLPSNR